MKRSRASSVRQIVTWAAGAVLTLSVAGWTVSLFRVEWRAPRSIAFLNGELIVCDNSTASRSRWYVWGYDSKYGAPRWRWLQVGSPHSRPYSNGPHLYFRLPFWIPATVATLVFVPLWLARRRFGRSRTTGLCLSCAYDLTGITGPCPECGHKP